MIPRMTDALLTLTAGLPQRSLAAGEVVYRHRVPGSVVGEIGALLHQPRSAPVRAAEASVVREIGDPDEFFAANPKVGLEVARRLAARLSRLTAYVADVQRQFEDHDDHLGVFGELLNRIADRPPVDIEPGSDRSPDY